MRPAYRYALVALLATALAVGVGIWLGSRPPRVARPIPRPVSERVAVPSQGAPTAEQEAEMLDRVEEKEAAELGPQEAARRRLQRERMLDLRLRGEE